MRKISALTLAAMVGAASSASAQVSTFSYTGEVIEVTDDLGIFGSVAIGDEGTGGFVLDLDAQAYDLPIGARGLFDALGVNLALGDFAIDGTAGSEHQMYVAASDNITIDGDVESSDILEIVLAVGESQDYDFGSVRVLLVGTGDWFENVETLPDPLSMGFENLLRAEVVIEFAQFTGGGDGDGNPGDGGGGDDIVMVTSRAMLDISSLVSASGFVATIGCRSYQFAAPVAQFDFFDISEFIVEFTAQTPASDMNSDGMFNFFDITEFVNQVQTGCSN